MKGWVYVISNQAMPGLVKVGYSLKDPDLRAEELNHTGSPYPYIVEYEMLIEEPLHVEQKVHKFLSNNRERKEWFRCSAEEAVAAIKYVAGDSLINENFKKAQREKTELIRRQQALEVQRKSQQETEEREIKQKLHDEESEIVCHYQSMIAGRFPPRPFWEYWLWGVVLALIGLAIFSPEFSDGGALFLAAIGSPIIGYFLQAYFEKHRKHSAAYRALLQERDEKLAKLRSSVVACPGCQQKVRFESSKLLSASSSRLLKKSYD